MSRIMGVFIRGIMDGALYVIVPVAVMTFLFLGLGMYFRGTSGLKVARVAIVALSSLPFVYIGTGIFIDALQSGFAGPVYPDEFLAFYVLRASSLAPLASIVAAKLYGTRAFGKAHS